MTDSIKNTKFHKRMRYKGWQKGNLTSSKLMREHQLIQQDLMNQQNKYPEHLQEGIDILISEVEDTIPDIPTVMNDKIDLPIYREYSCNTKRSFDMISDKTKFIFNDIPCMNDYIGNVQLSLMFEQTPFEYIITSGIKYIDDDYYHLGIIGWVYDINNIIDAINKTLKRFIGYQINPAFNNNDIIQLIDCRPGFIALVNTFFTDSSTNIRKTTLIEGEDSNNIQINLGKCEQIRIILRGGTLYEMQSILNRMKKYNRTLMSAYLIPASEFMKFS